MAESHWYESSLEFPGKRESTPYEIWTPGARAKGPRPMTVTGIAFAIAYFIGIGLALFRNPVFGLFTYVAVFYLHPPSRWWGAFLPDLRWSFLAAGVTLLAIWLSRSPGRMRRSWITTTPAKIMIAYLIWFWIESLWALDGALHNSAAILVTKYVLVFYMVYRLIDTPKLTTDFLLAHVAGCLYLGILGHQMGAPGGRLDGVGGPGIDDSNTLGMQLATGVVVAAMLSLHVRGWRLALCILSIAFSLNALVLTGTRGGFLALLAGGLMLAYLKPFAYRRLFYVYGLMGVLALGYVASDQFWERMATTKVAAAGDAEQMDTSAYSRIEIIKAQIEMSKRFPFGAGHRGSEILSPEYLEAKYLTETGARSSHNVLMTLLVEEGIPGALLFFAMVGWTAFTLRDLKRNSRGPGNVTRAVQAAAVGGALMVVLVGGLFADFSQCEVQIWMLALLAGLARSSTRMETKEHRPPAQTPLPLAEPPTLSNGRDR
jgi:hypothetical protein